MSAAEIYEGLLNEYGKPQWWSDNPYTVIVEAILVQNTSWSSVRKVSEKVSRTYVPEEILSMPALELEDLIRPCGFCKRKADTIRRITEWFGRYDFNPESEWNVNDKDLRNELTSIKGIGYETADVILVYAFHRPHFIIDAYTRQIYERLGLQFSCDDEIRSFIKETTPTDYKIHGWYHWLLLQHGINRCKKKPLCIGCPFVKSCIFAGSQICH